MKKTLIALVAAAALASTAAAQTAAPKPAKQTATKQAPATKEAAAKPAKPMSMEAEVVSVDAAAKTITVKGTDGSSQTLMATGSAVAQLSKVKAGEKVHVTVEGTNVSKIAPVKAAKTTEKKK